MDGTDAAALSQVIPSIVSLGWTWAGAVPRFCRWRQLVYVR
jgi:hypothetical protein